MLCWPAKVSANWPNTVPGETSWLILRTTARSPKIQVDLKTMFDLARRAGYPGYFSMEFDIAAGDPFPGTERLITKTLQSLT
jgi:hypothetical protein